MLWANGGTGHLYTLAKITANSCVMSFFLRIEESKGNSFAMS